MRVMWRRMKLNNKEIKSLFKSFVYAFRGLLYCIKNERNMRIHIVVASLVLPFAFIYGLTRAEYAILIVIMGLVMVCELINTAIEALVNLGAPSYESLARIAKDVAAGAVLMCSLVAVGIAIALFVHPDKLFKTILLIITFPPYLIFFLIVIVLGIIFIFKGFGNKGYLRKKGIDEVKIYHPKPLSVRGFVDGDDETIKIYSIDKKVDE